MDNQMRDEDIFYSDDEFSDSEDFYQVPDYNTKKDSQKISEEEYDNMYNPEEYDSMYDAVLQNYVKKDDVKREDLKLGSNATDYMDVGSYM